MKLSELIERAPTAEEIEHMRAGLGTRPDHFKYTGPPAIWVHWCEAEDYDDLMEIYEELAEVDGEFCVSSVSGHGGIHTLGGLVFYGKPSYHFPMDIHSWWDEETGLRYLITPELLAKRKKSVIHKVINNMEYGEMHTDQQYDEAWVNLRGGVKFVGACSASYGKSMKLLDPNDPDSASQLRSIIDPLVGAVEAGKRAFGYVDGTKFEAISPELMKQMVAHSKYPDYPD